MSKADPLPLGPCLDFSIVFPVSGEKDESKVSFRPRASWSPTVISVPRVGPSSTSLKLSRYRVSGYRVHLSLVSRLPFISVVYVLAEPELVNSNLSSDFAYQSKFS